MLLRQPAVAGLFYPASAQELDAMLDALFSGAQGTTPDLAMKALIAPHAGYIYSGPTAAEGYVRWRNGSARRVVLVGPSHRVPFTGLAAPKAEAFATPLGVVRVDRQAVDALQQKSRWVQQDDLAHAWEHSLEVQLPFLQRLFGGDFFIVPLVAGECPAEAIADVLQPFWEEPNDRIVISSDLSHYLPDAAARKKDARTIAKILEGQGSIVPEEACGCVGINGLLALLARMPHRIELLDYRTSGDTAGDRDRVVGYASIGVWPQ